MLSNFKMRCIKEIRTSPFLSFLLIFFLVQSCTPIPVKRAVHPPYTDQEINSLLRELKTQENAVHSFFSNGRIMFQRQGSEVEASVLIVGTRDPIKLKIEITHLWGRPLVHILITEKKIHLLSFSEKRYYTGNIGEPFISNLLPIHLDARLLWAIGRGFPILCEYHHATSPEGNRISLLNREKTTIQRIEFYPESDLPHQALYSDHGLEVSFSDFETENNIRFARETGLFDQKAGATLRIDNKQMVFNKAIDASVFDFIIPAGFKLYRGGPRLDTQ